MCHKCLLNKREMAKSLSEKQRIFTMMVCLLIDWAFQNGYELTFGEVWRSREQAEIYAKRGIGVKNSKHCNRLAVDFNLFIEGEYQTDAEAYKPLTDYWVSLDGKAGYYFKNKDANHLEY